MRFGHKSDKRTRYERGSELARQCFEHARDPQFIEEGASEVFECFGEIAGKLANKHRAPGTGIQTKEERARLRAALIEFASLIAEPEEVKDDGSN